MKFGRLEPTRGGRIGLLVAISLAAGLIAAVALVAAPFVPSEENALTGVVLPGFALGWSLLAVLSVRFTDQPQLWAAAPAAFMGLVGLALLSGWAAVLPVLGWVWPPVLFGSSSGCSCGSDGSCAAEARGGCCTPYWRC
jgi:hypothetical protein